LSYINPQITPPSPLKVAGRRGAFIWRILLHHVEIPPEKPADLLGGGRGGMLCIWLGLAHFHNGYSFLMISPNLLDIWPIFFLVLSRYETAQVMIRVTKMIMSGSQS
jgi:hypothetical protein